MTYPWPLINMAFSYFSVQPSICNIYANMTSDLSPDLKETLKLPLHYLLSTISKVNQIYVKNCVYIS